jgi:hypothetical protein
LTPLSTNVAEITAGTLIAAIIQKPSIYTNTEEIGAGSSIMSNFIKYAYHQYHLEVFPLP